MKTPVRHFLAGILALATPAFFLHAQAPAPAPAAAPAAGDPFVKDAAAAKVKKDEPWKNILLVLEVYALDKNEALAVLEGETVGAARYRRVRELSKTGKARLQVLTAATSKSGTRGVTEGIDEVLYPTEFNPSAFPNSPASPTAWEIRPTGDIFEVEAILGRDGRTCDINLAPSRISLKGFQDTGGVAEAGQISQPQFFSQKITTTVTVRDKEPFYLGTFTPPGQRRAAPETATTEVWFAFLTMSAPGPTADELKPPAKPNAPSINLEYSSYSLDREQARDLLAGASGLNGPWEQLQTLLKDKKARIEHVGTINTKSGQRAVVEENEEVRYPTEYVPETLHATSSETVMRTVKTQTGPGNDAGKNAPENSTTERVTTTRMDANAAKQPGYPSAFEMRNVGITLEVEVVAGPDGVTLDINQVIQHVTHLGNLEVTGVATRYPAQPLFETRKVTNSQNLLLGRHVLIGTLSPPGANGVNKRSDSGRTWLLFVRAVNEP
jgi:hypothetical protein